MNQALQGLFLTKGLIRLVSILLVLGIIFATSDTATVLIFFAFAIGHVVMAFWYQKDAGKWNARKLIFSLALILLLAVLCSMYPATGFVITSIAFALHMMVDEIHLYGGSPSIARLIELTPFMVIWGALTLATGYGIHISVLAYAASAVVVLGYAVFLLIKKHRPDGISSVLIFWAVAALVASLFIDSFGIVVAPTVWFFGLATVHFLIWYGDYYLRVRTDPVKKARYVRRTLNTNVVAFILAFLYGIGLTIPLAIIFSVAFVNAWSLVHIGSSFRVSTFSQFLKLPG